MSHSLLLVGTRKGLWIGHSEDDRRTWSWDGPRFPMNAVYSACVDVRGERPRLLAGAQSEHWGPQVWRSDDLGVSWQETPGGAVRFPDDTATALEQVWQIQPGTPDRPDVIYAGTQPSALFCSTDRGESFDLVRTLWDHPHRLDWGAGFGGQAIHSIVVDQQDPDRVTVAMSTGGVYQTVDGGASWQPQNVGIKAYFFPDPWPEFGQCVHKIAAHPSRPERMYAQNHHGVYRTDDGGGSWTSIAEGLPSDFGFPMVVHPHRPETIYVFPLVADGDRMPPAGKARVWRSDDAGESWRESGAGLPDDFYAAVMRDALCADGGDPLGVYLGARDGSLWGSRDEGDTWELLVDHLPDVMCVRAVVLS